MPGRGALHGGVRRAGGRRAPGLRQAHRRHPTSEIPRLDALYERGLEHGLAVPRLGAAEAREHEPHVAAVAALHVASTGVIDYGAVCAALRRLVAAGAELRLATEVLDAARAAAGAW